MKPVTRRGALSLIPAAAASIAAPVAALAAIPTPSPDAKLLALGQRFDALTPMYAEADTEMRRLFPVWENELARRGLEWSPERRGKAWNDKRNAAACEVGYSQASDSASRLCGRMMRLSARIRKHEPQTLAGLAVWARAALFETRDYDGAWRDPDASDAVRCEVHDLVALIERMAGEA